MKSAGRCPNRFLRAGQPSGLFGRALRPGEFRHRFEEPGQGNDIFAMLNTVGMGVIKQEGHVPEEPGQAEDINGVMIEDAGHGTGILSPQVVEIHLRDHIARDFLFAALDTEDLVLNVAEGAAFQPDLP